MKSNRIKPAHAAAQLLGIIDELRRNIEAAQDANRTYKEFIASQAVHIQILETDLKIKQLENAQLQRTIDQRRARK